MTIATFIALLQSTGFLHLLFSTLSVLLPQATKDQPVWFVVRRVIDWAALNVGNAENLPKKCTLSPRDAPSQTDSEKTLSTLSTLPTLPTLSPVPVSDTQASDGSDVPKFPN